MEDRNYRINNGILFRVPYDPKSRLSPELARNSRKKLNKKSIDVTDLDKEFKMPRKYVLAKVTDGRLTPHPPELRNLALTPTHEAKNRYGALMQPRQTKESPRKTPTKLSELSSMAQDMKNLFENLPTFRVEPRIHNSVLHQRIPDIVTTKKRRNRKDNISFDSKYLDVSKSSRVNLTSHRIRSNSRTSDRKEASEIKRPSQVHTIQQYFLEFHQRSKFLLSQLEQKVLGKKTVYE